MKRSKIYNIMRESITFIKQNKKIYFIIISIGALLLSVFIFFMVHDKSLEPILLYVNGEPVYEVEYMVLLNKNRSIVFDYFEQKHGVNPGENFWTTSYDGDTPILMIKKMTLDETIKIKIQQILAREKGIVANIDYLEFQEALETENANRKNAVENNKVIYGPIEYDVYTYFDYIFSNMITILKENLGYEMKISNEQLLAEYERTKDAFYQREPYIKIQKLSISFVEMKGDKEIVKDEVLNDMKKIKESLDKGNDFEVVAQKFVDSEYEIGYEVQEFNQETARSDSRFYYEIKNKALKLKPGENSEVFEFDNRFYIIRCLEKKAMGYMDFSEVKSDVLAKTIQNSYSDRIDDMVKAAVVEINDNLYGRIEVQ